MKIHAYAALKPKGQLAPFEYEPKALGPMDVEIRVAYCGICHSDVHLLDGDWGTDVFPLVPGHEIVGMVTAMGKEVGAHGGAPLHVGRRVGVGYRMVLKCT